MLALTLIAVQTLAPLGVAGSAQAQTALQVGAGGPYSGTTGTAVTMVATVSNAINPQFTWSFGDGSTGTGQVATHVYSSASSYTVTVTAVDINTARSGSASTTATINGGSTGALTVGAGGPYTGTTGSTVTMVATVSNAVSPQFTWSFGDGTTGTGQVTTHIYNAATTFPVMVTVVDTSTGLTSSASTSAAISGGNSTGALTVNTSGPYTGTVGMSLTMTATASGAASPQYTWSFGDGTSGNGQTVTHAYSSATTFSVTISVTDSSSGRTGSASTTATISAAAGLQYCNSLYTYSPYCTGYGSTGYTYCNGTLAPAGSYCPTATASYAYPNYGYAPTYGYPQSAYPQSPIGTYTYPWNTGANTPASSGCTLGVPPCAAGQTCTPIGAGHLQCTNAAALTAPAVTAAGAPAPPPGPTAGFGGSACAAGGPGTPFAGGPPPLNPIPGIGRPAGAAGTPGSANAGDPPPLNLTAGAGGPACAATPTAALAAGSLAAPTAPVAAANAVPHGIPVTYATGWNLVAGPAGATISGADGPLYTLKAGDTSYETVPSGSPVAAGSGYWAYFDAGASGMLPAGGTQPSNLSLPAGQFVMIGNSSGSAVAVSGADIVYVYDPAAANYRQATTLAPGQGAWAFSNNGATASFNQPAATAPTGR